MEIKYVGKCLLIDKVLVIGDLHFGFSESARRAGVQVPLDIYNEVVNELDLIFERVEVDEVILLGDLKHEFGGISDAEWREIKNFIDYLKGKSKKIVIVRGNHDKITGIITGQKGLEIKDYYVLGDVAFVHGDKKLEGSEIYGCKCWVMGHGHPAVRISDGTKEEKYKCFLEGKWEGRKVIVVPSFFDVNEGTDPRDYSLGLAWDFDLNKFEVWVVAEMDVLNFGKLKNL